MSLIDVTNLTYEGEYAKEIFIKNLYESKLKSFGITYMPGVKGKQQLVSGDVQIYSKSLLVLSVHLVKLN